MEMFSNDILDKDKFWTDELMNVNKVFLFGLAQMGGRYGERKGIIEKHAYSIMEARELDNFRLLKIRYRDRSHSIHKSSVSLATSIFWGISPR